MVRLIILLALTVAAPTWAQAPEDLARLEKEAARVDRLNNVEARPHAQVYGDLADALVSGGRSADAADALEKYLKLDPGDMERQAQLFVLEIELDRTARAQERAELLLDLWSRGNAVAQEVLAKAWEVAGRKAPAPTADAESQPAPRPERKLLVIAFEGCDQTLFDAMCARLASELEIEVEVIDRKPVPTKKGLRTPSHEDLSRLAASLHLEPSSDVQDLIRRIREKIQTTPELDRISDGFERIMARDHYLADELCLQVLREVGHRVWTRNVVGVMGITDRPMARPGLNFLFGWSVSRMRVAVISYGHFGTPAHEVLITRTYKQALSSAGFLYGLSRCTDPRCARSYPGDLEEHDRKEPWLCRTCAAGFGIDR